MISKIPHTFKIQYIVHLILLTLFAFEWQKWK